MMNDEKQISRGNGQYDSQDIICGCGPCKPTWMQRLANPKVFTLNAGIIMTLNIMCFTYFGAILPSLERRFQLSSSESGALSIINDVVALGIVFFVSHFGHNSHRPRLVATGSIVYGIGTFLCAMPHFMSSPLDPIAIISGKFSDGMDGSNMGVCTETIAQSYNLSLSNTSIYGNQDNSFKANEACDNERSHSLGSVKWLVIGQIVTGLGLAPFYPLVVSYLDDSVGKTQLTSYTACLFISTAIGPTFGFFLSSKTSSLFVDFDRIPADEIPAIAQTDPRWIGAWWLGFVFAAVFIVIASLPMFFFPRTMLTTKLEVDAEDTGRVIVVGNSSALNTMGTEDESVQAKSTKRGRGFVSIFEALKRLVTNVPLMLMCLAASSETALIGIMGSFGVKTMQLQFSISPAVTTAVLGGILIPINILSQVVSAYICRKYRLGVRGCARLILLCLVIAMCIVPFLMFIGCENINVAGVNVARRSLNVSSSFTKESTQQAVKLISTCNAHCVCDDQIFRPVCGSDGVTYISPCHAGCTGFNSTIQITQESVYTNCQCIVDVNKTTTSNPAGSAVSGICLDCWIGLLVIAVLVFTPLLFVTNVIYNPVIYIVMRIVDEEDRSTAIALQSLISKCLGLFPSPVYFGAIINATCVFWQYSCGNRGSCWLYDIVHYRYAYYGTMSALRVCSVICYILVNLLIKPEPSELETNGYDGEHQKMAEKEALATAEDENNSKKLAE